MNRHEEDILDLRLSEQAIIRESFVEKNAQIHALEAQIRYLRDLVSEISAIPQVMPQRAQERRFSRDHVPSRWKVR